MDSLSKKISSLSRKEKMAYILLCDYDEEFEEIYEQPYWPTKDCRKELDKGLLSIFCGIIDFLGNEGFYITYDSEHWRGYLRYVFRYFKNLNVVPVPAQIKNRTLIRRYLEYVPTQEDTKPLDYSKIVVEEFQEHLGELGLGEV